MTAVELMCGWKDGAHIVSELAEKLGGHSQVSWFMRKEFPRDAEGSAIHEIRGRAARVFPPGCPDAEEYERELIHPAGALEASLEGSLQLPVKTLHETVGLRAVSRRVGGGDPEQLVEFRPHVAGELRATVGGDVVRHSEAGDPVADEGSRTGLGGGVGQWNGFRPPSEAVDDREEVLHALGLIEGAHQVDVETAKATVRGWSLGERCLNVSVDRRCLAGVAFSAPLADVSFQSMPHET